MRQKNQLSTDLDYEVVSQWLNCFKPDKKKKCLAFDSQQDPLSYYIQAQKFADEKAWPWRQAQVRKTMLCSLLFY